MQIQTPMRRALLSRVTQASVLLAPMLTLAACAPAQVVTRAGAPWPCVVQSQDGTQQGNAPMLGWVTSASIDRWIATIDRVGQRAGIFAAGSSVRGRAQEDAITGLAMIGVNGVRWIAPTRPWHATWQPAPATNSAAPVHQSAHVAFVVPTQGVGPLESALGKSIQGKHPDAPGVIVMLGKRKAWLSYVNHYTALLTFTPTHHQRTLAAAQCLHTRRPKALFKLGVAVAELARRHPEWFAEALKGVRKELKGASAVGGLAGDWFEQLRDLVAETEAVEVELLADKQNATLAGIWRATPRSELAARFARMAEAPPNPLIRRLPANSYAATGSVMDDRREMESGRKTLAKVLGLLKVRLTFQERILADLEAIIALSGRHSAAAIHPAKRLAIATQVLWTSSDAKRQLQLSSRMVLDLMIHVFRAARSSRQALVMGGPKARAETDTLLAVATSQGWAGLFAKLVQRSTLWPVRLGLDNVQRKGLECDVLNGHIDWARIRRKLPMAGAARAFLGDHIGVGLCTSDGLGMMIFNPDVIGEASRAASGKGDGFAGTALYKKAAVDRGQPAQWFTLIDPALVVGMARRLLDQLPAWPEGQPVVASCRYGAQSIRCRLDAPLALTEMVAPFISDDG